MCYKVQTLYRVAEDRTRPSQYDVHFTISSVAYSGPFLSDTLPSLVSDPPATLSPSFPQDGRIETHPYNMIK
jgi:hypothetical protein